MHPTPLRLSLGPGFDPSAVFAALYGDRDDVFWLDSGADGTSYLGAGTRVDVDADTVLQVLRAVPEPVTADDDAPAFRLGLVGWLGYELRAQTTGAIVSRPSRYPDAAFLRVDRAIAIDGATGQAELLALGSSWSGELAEWRDEVARLCGAGAQAPAPPLPEPTAALWHETDAEYLANVDACQAAIREGEAYQLCLTTEAEVVGRFDPLQVYLRLRASSPSHHGGLIRIGGVSLLSASPERFLDIDPDGLVRTRPIKGTRPRALEPMA
ncbi:MAG: chorismate-binding protein, partial [Pseudolysinimonas sp.]